METPIKMDDLGIPLFLETPIYEKMRMQTMSHARQYNAISWKCKYIYICGLKYMPITLEVKPPFF